MIHNGNCIKRCTRSTTLGLSKIGYSPVRPSIRPSIRPSVDHRDWAYCRQHWVPWTSMIPPCGFVDGPIRLTEVGVILSAHQHCPFPKTGSVRRASPPRGKPSHYKSGDLTLSDTNLGADRWVWQTCRGGPVVPLVVSVGYGSGSSVHSSVRPSVRLPVREKFWLLDYADSRPTQM